MKFKIPFTLFDFENQRRSSKDFISLIQPKKNSKLKDTLDSLDLNITREEYLGICAKNFIYSYGFFIVASISLFFYLKMSNPIITPLIISTLISSFIFFVQVSYPKAFANRKQREIEKSLIPGLQDMLVQLNSGIPLFSILINLTNSDYGMLSEEFRKIVKKINAGSPQAEVIEEVGDKNPSLHFRRALWQISNGMRAGSDISIIVKESVNSLREEQLIQIQNYGNKLNPLIMFYMLISVIVPALSITFVTIISSLIGLSQFLTISIFFGLFFFVLLMQFTFLGLIKSVRPSLMT